jgi:hypothetical protein
MDRNLTKEKGLETGQALGEILSNQALREAFAADPQSTLPSADLSSQLTVYADTADTIHLVVPSDIDEKSLAAADDAYLEELGRQALGACFYDDLPK